MIRRFRVSPHIADYEVRCKWTGEIRLMPQIVYLFESVRKETGKPIIITSGYRSEEYQAHLREIGYPAAVVSPHCVGAALDMFFPAGIDKNEFVEMFTTKSVELGYGKCRIGRRKYNDTFCHIDLVFMGFAPYTTVENPKPELWIPGNTW